MTNEQVYKILNDAPEGAEYFHKSYYKVTDGIIYLWVGCYEFWYSLENKAEFISNKLTEEKSLKGMENQLRKTYFKACEQAYEDMLEGGYV